MKLIDMEALKYFYGKLEQIFTGVTVTIDPQTFTEEQKAQARANIGAGSADFTGDYNDLINKPQVAGQSSINAGKTIKSWSETDGKVSITTQDIEIAKSQISDFAHTHTTSDITDLDDMGFATEQYVTNAIEALPSPMVFKGSLGTSGTITTLPVAAKANTGFTYKVITDGTYSGQAAKSGDMFISDGSAWIYIPSADEPSGTVTSVGVSVPTGLSVDNTPITSSGTIAISMESGYSIPTNTKQGQWDTAYTHSQSTHARTDATKVESSTNGKIKIDGVDTTVYSHPTQTAKTSGMYKITVDNTGHVSGATTASASDLSYTNTTSGLTATNVQTAIDELAGKEVEISVDGTSIVKSNENVISLASDLQNKINSAVTNVDSALSDTSENPVQNKVIKSEIDELKNSVSDGKSSIASAITNQGVTTASDATFATMATNIGLIQATASGTAVPSDVVKGKTFCSEAGTELVGTMESYTDEEIIIQDIAELEVESKDTFNRFVYVNYTNISYYSFDGINWTAMTPVYNFIQCDVTYGNGIYVSVGYYNNQLASVYSTNGESWIRSGIGSTYGCKYVAYGNGTFVALVDSSAYGYCYVSTNGINWDQYNPFSYYKSGYSGECVTYGKDKFVASWSNYKLLYSYNGKIWTSSNISKTLNSIAYGNNKYVGFQNGAICLSNDGITWESKNFDNYYGSGCAYGNGKFVTVGWYGKSYYSFDGINWTAMTGLYEGSNYRGVSYANGVFICVGNAGYNAYSTDGETWTCVRFGTESGLGSVAAIDSIYYYSYPISEGYHSSQKILIKK